MHDARLRSELHALEAEFGLSALEILDIINRRNRCKIAVRGAIAEAHLLRLLREMKDAGDISEFEDFDRDGYPDCRVDYHGRPFLLECKNVRNRSSGDVDIDFQRTRNPIGRPWERYYLPSEFEVVAACLWNRSRRWEFVFAATADLPRHPDYRDRVAPKVVVPISDTGPASTGTVWSPRLTDVLDRLIRVPPEGEAEAT